MLKHEANETMKLLGKQHIYTEVCPGGIANKDLKNILETYGELGKLGGIELVYLLVDVYTLGHINGKRAERARKKRSNKSTATNEAFK